MKATGKGIGYPSQYDVDVVLRDGSTVHLRPALSADLEALTRFLSGLSEESKVFRFFHAVNETADLDALRPQTVAAEARRMAAAQAAAGLEVTGFLVQQMVPKGVEMIVGVVQDPVFGPVVVCGAGGKAVELMKDLSVRLPPLTGVDAERMLRGLATFPLLDAYRGGSRVDMAALKGLLLQVSALAEDLPEVMELDLNPVVATSSGVITVDARLRIVARDPQRPEGSLLRAVR